MAGTRHAFGNTLSCSESTTKDGMGDVEVFMVWLRQGCGSVQVARDRTVGMRAIRLVFVDIGTRSSRS